ncbi:MAG TPA: hypothetical protein VG389_13835 [Myxococcota bacterium]|jgi:hypothetical protein|nr:hypothetical protein [Myxococcota bacterium]
MDGQDGKGRTPNKKVFGIIERPSTGDGAQGTRSFFVPIGVGWVGREGALNVTLDALPVSGKLYIRDYDKERDTARGRRDAAAGGAGAAGSNGGGFGFPPPVPNESDIPF